MNANESGITMACIRCNTVTAVETLSKFGARCYQCYAEYCREKNSNAEFYESSANTHTWATRLRDRERSGSSLTKFQKESWRTVLGNQ